MRIAFALPLLLLGACEANVDQANDSVSLEYDQELAENTAATVANEAGDIAGHIANDVQETGQRVENEVGQTDVDMDVDRTEPANAN